MGEEEMEGRTDAEACEPPHACGLKPLTDDSQLDSRRCHDCGTESGVRIDGLRSGRSCIGGGGDDGAAAGTAAAEVPTAVVATGAAAESEPLDADGADRGRDAEGGAAADC